MHRRWRIELAVHAEDRSYHWPAPTSCAATTDCHCANGIGTVRKKKPLDCGRVRCGVCHGEKFFAPKNRGAKKRAAIAWDLKAAGEI